MPLGEMCVGCSCCCACSRTDAGRWESHAARKAAVSISCDTSLPIPPAPLSPPVVRPRRCFCRLREAPVDSLLRSSLAGTPRNTLFICFSGSSITFAASRIIGVNSSSTRSRRTTSFSSSPQFPPLTIFLRAFLVDFFLADPHELMVVLFYCAVVSIGLMMLEICLLGELFAGPSGVLCRHCVCKRGREGGVGSSEEIKVGYINVFHFICCCSQVQCAVHNTFSIANLIF